MTSKSDNAIHMFSEQTLFLNPTNISTSRAILKENLELVEYVGT